MARRSFPLNAQLQGCINLFNFAFTTKFNPTILQRYTIRHSPVFNQQINSFSSRSKRDNQSDVDETYYRQYEKVVRESLQKEASTDVNKISATTIENQSPKILSHIDTSGKAEMVNVGRKLDTERVAVAVGRVHLTKETFALVAENSMKKGDVLSVAQLAGIMGAKRTSELIPLCHNIMITKVDVVLTLNSNDTSVDIRCSVWTVGKTGVEMEALTGVTVAGLTVYDMCKSVSHYISIGGIRLVKKSGGKSGEFVNE